ncbi:MAG: hypothetical protein MUO24_05380 [Desulfobacterales bacterium]|nr:hypothetical protein [Desulfobacterales bacterium]
MRRVYCYVIIFLAISILLPITPVVFLRLISFFSPANPFAATVAERDETAVIPIGAATKRIVTIDPGMIYIGDDGGSGLEYKKEFMVRSIGYKNILSLQIAGMVGATNDGDSEDYSNGFYTNKLYINGNYIDNLNNYVFQEEDEQFRTILVSLPLNVLRPGNNKLIVVAAGPKDGNHDDFALREIKLLQW